MQESFLHFIWKHQYFEKQNLRTTTGQTLHVLEPGKYNSDGGPDFTQARIQLDSMQWVGMVEIHVKSSQWRQHGHHLDPAYRDIILHVVWSDNQPLPRDEGLVPTLELQGRVAANMLLRHQSLLASPQEISCHGQFCATHHSRLIGMLDQAFNLRMRQKVQLVRQILEQEKYDWDATAYRIMGKNFGFKLNAGAFEDLVKAVPLPVAKKLYPRLQQLEALYFGQAGLLDKDSNDPYVHRLQNEYRYLLRLFPYLPKKMKPHQWKFLRLRPNNFPTLRIAQFALLMHHQAYRFSQIRELNEWHQLRQIMDLHSPAYWQHHYHFGKIAPKKSRMMGVSSIQNIAINTVVPLKMTYFQYMGKRNLHSWVRSFLNALPPERNTITRYWKEIGFGVSSAYHSQALLALNEHYCQAKKCLSCSVGLSLIKDKVQ